MGLDPDFFREPGLGDAPAPSCKSDFGTRAAREAAKHKLRDDEGNIKFPINDCADVADAWQLRGSSNIPKEKVEAYIRRVAAELGCDGPWNEKAIILHTPLEEIEKALCRQIAGLDLSGIAERAAVEALDRHRGRV